MTLNHSLNRDLSWAVASVYQMLYALGIGTRSTKWPFKFIHSLSYLQLNLNKCTLF